MSASSSSSSDMMYSHHQHPPSSFYSSTSSAATSSGATSHLLNSEHMNALRHGHSMSEMQVMEQEHSKPAPTGAQGEVPVKREKRKYRCRKRSPATIERAKTVRRDKANARERRRMNSLNDALEVLREILPSLPDEPKMTKIETLRKAQDYIASLRYQLSSPSSTSPDSPTGSFSSSTFCESGCSSLQSTPFQSPCFPTAPGAGAYSSSTASSYSNIQNVLPHHHHQMNNNYPFHHLSHDSPHFPK